MLGPFNATSQEARLSLLGKIRDLSSFGERIYVCEGTESHDADYPELNGMLWWYLGNSHDTCKRHVESGIESGAYDSGKLIGMAMDGEWFNQYEVIERRAMVAGVAKKITDW